MDNTEHTASATFGSALLGHLLIALWSGVPAAVLLLAGETRAGVLCLLLPAALTVWAAARLIRRP
ncbi:hypothetical protein GCM10009678_39050 [Actinomadura kijaniata]|uniref:Uncharacterized protein n=1 Tax=Actinomadura namibiensis TaxID=182080 RepID=A0A7W3LV81_ACTNM|nr:hypothetical protein [Actinomadura namibiensis]MBA8954847.1 hypothetical protein [Actinomadura namibiensis]